MWKFFRKKKNSGLLEEWVRKEIKEENNDSNSAIVFFKSVMLAISLFNKGTSRYDQEGRYCCDTCRFELGMFIVFYLDYYFHCKGSDKAREYVTKFIVPKFSEVFNGVLNISNANQLIKNRLLFYAQVSNEGRTGDFLKRTSPYLEELIFRTGHNTLPKEVVKASFHKTNLDFMDRAYISSSLHSFLGSILPNLHKNIDRLLLV